MRLIDADALIEMEKTRGFRGNTFGEVVKLYADEMPTIEERKTGEWIHIRDEENGNGLYECSICHRGDIHAPEAKVNFCWNCGAKMEGGKDE